MDDTMKKLGKVQSTDQGRDAIHIAVLTMQAKKTMYVYGNRWVDRHGTIVNDGSEYAIGIIDPFLTKNTIAEGQWFYVYLKPASITGLKHIWSHPDFEEGDKAPAVETKSAEERIKRFLDGEGINYDAFIEALTTGRSSVDDEWEGHSYEVMGDALYSYGRDASGYIPDEIIDDVETVTGQRIKNRPTHFSCSC